MKFERSSGILIHLTSLPSRFGIGDMGPAAYEFVDFLAAAGQRYWQLLPLSPTRDESGNSPYSSPSAFAGNVLLISPEELVKDGYLEQKNLKPSNGLKNGRVNYTEVIRQKVPMLHKVFETWNQHTNEKRYRKFCNENSFWLEDFALYMSLREKYRDQSWAHWPEELRQRKSKALKQASSDLATEIEREKFLQYLFFIQWEKLRDYAHSKGVQLIGDIPFYVNYDSADCWAHPEIFKLDKNFKPISVAGVPPDFFSETGQLWGSPVFDWARLKKKNYRWWLDRLRQNLALFDVLRLDHFRAFSAFWEVPAGEGTAINGKWANTPGTDFFEHVKKIFSSMPFIAEDLGTIDQPVYDLRDQFELPGMKVLQFAFGDDMAQNDYVPHKHIPHCLVCTGTHDNNTVRGWYNNAPREVRKNLRQYLGKNINGKTVAENLHRLALQSVADLVIIPMQDILGLGEDAIMNRPGTGERNWEWRMKTGHTGEVLAVRLKCLNQVYGRLRKKHRLKTGSAKT